MRSKPRSAVRVVRRQIAFLVGMAVLGLVASAAGANPLMWVVDDAQWLDRASVQTIGFVSRRLQTERVVIAMAARDTGDDGELAGLPELRLGGLGVDDAGALFDSVAGPVDAAVRDRILAGGARESACVAGAPTGVDDRGTGGGARGFGSGSP